MKPATVAAAILLTVVSILQLLRAVAGVRVMVGDTVIPIWVSVVAFVVAGGLSDRTLARGTKKWLSTRSACSRDRRRVVYRSRQSSVGVAVAVNSDSGAAGASGRHLSGTGGV
jgi:hypothetical protein